MRIPNNVVIIWTGTHAGIPSGWTRETTLDSTYIKATAVSTDPNITGGATTHTHTSPTHTHTLGAHTHTYTLTALAEGEDPQNRTDQLVNDLLENNSHSHTGTSGASNGGTTATTAVTYGSFSTDPPYTTVIYIKSSGGAYVKAGCIMLTSSTSSFTGWQLSDGTNGSVDIRNKYLKGAATGADAGGTGGTYTNSHDITHTHTTNTHTHDAANSAATANGSKRDSGNNAPAGVDAGHVHSVTLGAGTQALNQNTDTLVTAETVEPAYKKLVALYSTSSTTVYKGMIGMWLGTLVTIPGGWILCDGTNGTTDMRGQFLKIANTTGEIGNTGGSNTHTHAAQSHSHTSNGTHTHAVTSDAHVASTTAKRRDSGIQPFKVGGSHAASTSDAGTGTYASSTTTADSSDNQPAFRTVAFIQLNSSSSAGFLLNFV